jgi:hypothetical protein
MGAMLLAHPPSSQPETFLRQQLGFSSSELDALEKGSIIAKLPRTPETREVAALAIMRLEISSEFFVEHVRDIVNFKKSDNVLQIGKFSNPPELEDLAGLTLEPSEIDSMRRCRIDKCGLKMSKEFMDRLGREVNWTAADYRERATAVMRDTLLKYVQSYLRVGRSALGAYRDKSPPLRVGDELAGLLQPAPYMYEYVPEFQRYLLEFPRSPSPDAEDFVYWSKEKFGLKPVISVTHVTIYKLRQPGGLDVIIASQGIYATHYFEASLGLTAFVHSQGGPPRSYLIYVNRSRADALRGLFAGLARALISGSLRDGTKKNMELIRQRLEDEFKPQRRKSPR